MVNLYLCDILAELMCLTCHTLPELKTDVQCKQLNEIHCDVVPVFNFKLNTETGKAIRCKHTLLWDAHITPKLDNIFIS